MEIKKIIEEIEKHAPLSEAEEWDNSGWQVMAAEEETDKVLVSLDVNDDVVEQAVQKACKLILSHHPIFFSPIKTIVPSFITKAIKNNIGIYSAHTNLDKAKGGVNDTFASLCGYDNPEILYEFVKYKKLDTPQDMKALIERVKGVFNITELKVANLNKAKFSKIAFCSGAGHDYIEILDQNGIDVYLTGDIKYHQAQLAKRMTIIDIGHFNSEKCAGDVFRKILSELPVEIVEAKEKDVFEYV